MIDKFQDEHCWLSNFWPCIIKDDLGREWLSAEAAYQAMKSEDRKVQDQFLELNPFQAKKLGKRILIRPGWANNRLEVMKRIVMAKFTQNRDLKEKLISTGDEELIEGNWWGDTFWGVCHGKGQNHLGKILMEVRKELR